MGNPIVRYSHCLCDHRKTHSNEPNSGSRFAFRCDNLANAKQVGAENWPCGHKQVVKFPYHPSAYALAEDVFQVCVGAITEGALIKTAGKKLNAI